MDNSIILSLLEEPFAEDTSKILFLYPSPFPHHSTSLLYISILTAHTTSPGSLTLFHPHTFTHTLPPSHLHSHSSTLTPSHTLPLSHLHSYTFTHTSPSPTHLYPHTTPSHLHTHLHPLTDSLPTVTAIVRSPTGRYVWSLQLRHHPRSEQVRRGGGRGDCVWWEGGGLKGVGEGLLHQCFKCFSRLRGEVDKDLKPTAQVKGLPLFQEEEKIGFWAINSYLW